MDGGAPISVFESGAILLYLAQKIEQFIPASVRGSAEVIEWLFWQVAGLGPMAGQNHHFSRYAPQKIPYAIERYVKETNRLYGVLNRRLADREFVAGDYSIADMAAYPWVVPHEAQGQNLADFPHLQRWFETIRAPPGHRACIRARREARQRRPDDRGAKEDPVRPDGGIGRQSRIDRQGAGTRQELRFIAASRGDASSGDPAIALVLVHDAHRLHEGVADGRADEAESPLFEVFAHRIAVRRRFGHAAKMQRSAAQHLAVRELPDVVVERTGSFADLEIGARVCDEGLDLQPVPDDARISQQALTLGGLP